MENIGIIGVGYIGKGFVDRLVETDRNLYVYDIDPDQVAYAEERGGKPTENAADLTDHVDAVVMAVPGTPEVEETMTGTNGVTETLTPDQLVIDVSTTLPDTSKDAADWCAEIGADFIEAPITGAAPREGMHMMIGGPEATYHRASPLLDDLCDNHIRIGDVGDATIFKLGLQMRYAGHDAIDAEVVEFVNNHGVDPEPFNDFLEMGVLDNYFTNDFRQDLEGMGALRIWHKDIGYAQQVAHESNTALPLNGGVQEAYKAVRPNLAEDEGHPATLIRYWRTLNNNV